VPQPGIEVQVGVGTSAEYRFRNGDGQTISQATVTLTQTIPLSFLPIINIHTAQVSATATASRAPAAVDLVLALDSSMCNRAGGPRLCFDMREGALALADEVLARGGRIGLVDFRRSARLLQAPTADAEQVGLALSNWGRGSFSTQERNFGDGLWLAVSTAEALPADRLHTVLFLATDDASVGRNCCAECLCSSDQLAVCDWRCSYEYCCADWSRQAAVHARLRGVPVIVVDGTGTVAGTQLMRDIARQANGGEASFATLQDWYILVGRQEGKKPKPGDYQEALAKVVRLLGGEGATLVR
jgi:hypothetical protein